MIRARGEDEWAHTSEGISREQCGFPWSDHSTQVRENRTYPREYRWCHDAWWDSQIGVSTEDTQTDLLLLPIPLELRSFLKDFLRLGLHIESDRNEGNDAEDRETEDSQEFSSRILRKNGIDISEMEADASSHERYGNR